MNHTKHIYVLNLLASIPGPTLQPDLYYGQPHFKSPVTVDQATAAWDHLFEYIFIHWATPLSATVPVRGAPTEAVLNEVRECQALLQYPKDVLMAKLETLPPALRDEIFPVAVAIYLLRTMAIPLNHRATTTFPRFHERYGYMILSY